MSNKKLKGFKLFPELVKRLSQFAKKYRQTETTVVEAALDHLLTLPEPEQKKILSSYLTKNL